MGTDRARLYIEGQTLHLEPPTGHTYREVREALGATWSAPAWKMPVTRSNVVQVLEAFGDDVDLTEEVKALGDGHGFPLLEVDHPNLPDLFPFQREAVRYLASNSRGTLLNVSPGLGKTAVSIVAAQAVSVSRALIVAPASLLFNWKREIARWALFQEVTIAHGTQPLPTGWIVTSYDTVVRHPAWFAQDWDLLVIDESVLIKNRATKRYKAVEKVRARAQRVWMLSGSPTTRYADDLWTQMHLAFPGAFKSYWRFADRFCVFEPNIWSRTGKEIVGTRESRDLTWELGDLMLTVNQEDVLPELPDYLFETIEVQLGEAQQKAYVSMLHDFLVELDSKELTADNKLAQLIRLQQITSGMANLGGSDTSSVKMDALLDGIEASRWQFPMIVWTHWRGAAEHLHKVARARALNAEWVSGSDDTKTRDAKFEAYKAGHTDILVLSLGVGKFGHTLTNTRTVVYLDKTWSADDYVQSLRRVRRIGLTWRPLLVTLHATGTTDELVEMNLAGKMPSISKVTNSQLKELLKGLGL